MTKKPVKKGKSSTSKEADEVQKRRDAFRNWLAHNNVNANEAAKKAGISVSAIYNFLNGDTKSLSSGVLAKLAEATNSSVDDILIGKTSVDNSTARRHIVPVLFRIGARGSMFVCEEKLVTTAPDGVALPNNVMAAVVDGDGLLPIPNGWTVFFREEAANPSKLEGKFATVRYSGGGDRPVVRTVMPSKFEGLYTLRAMDGTLTEDVQIVAAHEIVAFGQSKISEA